MDYLSGDRCEGSGIVNAPQQIGRRPQVVSNRYRQYAPRNPGSQGPAARPFHKAPAKRQAAVLSLRGVLLRKVSPA